MDKANDNSSYMRMISESHASSSSPLVYTCSAQPSSFHCMKGYRQLAAAYDSTPFDSSPSPSYPSIKQEPIDYTTCENPYEQGMLQKDFRLNFLVFTPHLISELFFLASAVFLFFTNFHVLLLPRQIENQPLYFCVNLIFFSSLEPCTC